MYLDKGADLGMCSFSNTERLLQVFITFPGNNVWTLIKDAVSLDKSFKYKTECVFIGGQPVPGSCLGQETCKYHQFVAKSTEVQYSTNRVLKVAQLWLKYCWALLEVHTPLSSIFLFLSTLP